MTDRQPDSLSGIRLLEGVPEATCAKLARQATWRRYKQHEQIIDRDSDTSDIYFVTRGIVRVVNFSLSGREVSFDEVEAGGFFGELSAIDGRPRSATVVALTETDVAAISPRVFKGLLEEHPPVALVIIERLTEIVRQSTERIMDLSTLGAHNRVHAELLRLARHAADDEVNEAKIKPAPIHADIASRVSTTRETVARVLGDLARSGLVTREDNTLMIHDLDRLEDMVTDLREG